MRNQIFLPDIFLPRQTALARWSAPRCEVSAPECLRGDFDSALPTVERYFADRKGHRTNPVELDGELMAEIDSHWQPYAEAFGYH